MKKLIFLILVSCVLLGCEDYINCGKVIKKEHISGYQTVVLQPMMVGKIVNFIPIVQNHPERWCITIQGYNKNEELVERNIDVEKERYDKVNENDDFCLDVGGD